MRRCFLSLLPLLLLACSEKNSDSSNGGDASADITIVLNGAAPGNVLLVGQYMDQQYRMDSARVETDGTVRFQRDVPYEPGYYFAFFTDQTTVPLLLDQDQTFTLRANRQQPVGSMGVEGSIDNQLLYESLQYERTIAQPLAAMNQLLGTMQPEQPEYAQLLDARDRVLSDLNAFYEKQYGENPNAFYTAYQRAAQNPPVQDLRKADGSRDKSAQVAAYRKNFWDGVDFSDERLLRTPAVANKLRRYITELTPQRADSVTAAADHLLSRVLDENEFYRFFANYITLQYQPGTSALMDGEAVYVHMIQNYYTRERAFWTDSMTVFGLLDQADMMAHSLVGQPGPNLKVPGLDGKTKEIYGETKPYVVVYIYNPECDHCIEETPKLLDWYRQNRSRAAVYAIALDTDDAKWRSFVDRFGLGDWTNVYDPTNQAVFKTYFVDHTPEIYLLDGDRTIIAKNLAPDELNAAITGAEG
ncbi:DUF5106 domain-containing protein [Neolewinella litorea]|uniref:DUF5106 domain-containing protein n=1 Tax=Neolewinella litorea TaxID=2562452 RepID=A0A4S4NRV5_9BACT|nr:DUF5106 domain-containing protein [Neolewinella litorea]THH41118.1 DUF5106 domain-containing protein [Neolewinella litorea]